LKKYTQGSSRFFLSTEGEGAKV